MGYAEESVAREERMKKRLPRAGESQTHADTRTAQSRVKTGVFVPASVREAQLRTGRSPYRGRDAKRMASFHASTAGQRMRSGDTMSDPFTRGMNSPQNSSRPALPSPDPVQINSGASTQLDTITPAPVMPMASPAPTDKPSLELPSNVTPNSPQANFLANKGNMTPEQITQAHAYADKMGTTFDPETGYSREAFENAPKNPTTVLPAKRMSREEAIAAGESRMQGYRENNANGLPMSKQAIAATKRPSKNNRKVVDAAKSDPILPEPTSAASGAKLVGDSTLPNPEPVAPVKKSPSLYTGGEVAEQAIAEQVEKADAPKPKKKTVLRLDPSVKETAKKAVDSVKKKAAPNIDRTKENLEQMPDRIAANVANAKKSTSDAIEKVKSLPGVKQVREYLAAADQRKSIADLNRRMKHKLSAGKLSTADIQRYQKLAKSSGVKFDALKGFYL